jgi:hypothetical protein
MPAPASDCRWTTPGRFITIGARSREGNQGGASTIVAGIDPKYYYYVTLGLLGVCTLVGMVIAFRFQREVEHDLAPTTEKDLLGPLEKAYYSGLMDEAEFKRIRESMEKRKAGDVEPAPRRPAARKATIEPEPGDAEPMGEAEAEQE